MKMLIFYIIISFSLQGFGQVPKECSICSSVKIERQKIIKIIVDNKLIPDPMNEKTLKLQTKVINYTNKLVMKIVKSKEFDTNVGLDLLIKTWAIGAAYDQHHNIGHDNYKKIKPKLEKILERTEFLIKKTSKKSLRRRINDVRTALALTHAEKSGQPQDDLQK